MPRNMEDKRDLKCIVSTVFPPHYTVLCNLYYTCLYYLNHSFEHMLWQELPSSQGEREREVSWFPVEFFEGCTELTAKLLFIQ